MKEQFNREFLPREIVLKLVRDFGAEQFEQKINLIKDYTRTIKSSFDSRVFKTRYNNEIGFIYWEAQQYESAIPFFRKAIENLNPEDAPFLYFHIIGLLIRCNRHINNYSASFTWVDRAINNLDAAESSFQRLNILGEYTDLLNETNEKFDYDPKMILQIIEDLGFPKQIYNPKETIDSMRRTNKIWNRKLSEIELMGKTDKDSLISIYIQFKKDCPIKWYCGYADEKIKRIKNNS
ncbi:tetratricopeptide repeat protein [Echinicola marina]|uniref:tetratricopeptide repeat protein n=1 Tax=Echinicola marina TaxID=2859768 RepID=UPI001CF62927|nr:tetratricopeptide repeat protein [Echinicola marina]UCS92155.1 tetratricopeptide repeat protein [Echinicola marina]